jgi:hypothetical protein
VPDTTITLAQPVAGTDSAVATQPTMTIIRISVLRISISVVSAFRRTCRVRLKPDTTSESFPLRRANGFRQRDPKRTASTARRFQREMSAAHFDGPLGNRQAEPCPASVFRSRWTRLASTLC